MERLKKTRVPECIGFIVAITEKTAQKNGSVHLGHAFKGGNTCQTGRSLSKGYKNVI